MCNRGKSSDSDHPQQELRIFLAFLTDLLSPYHHWVKELIFTKMFCAMKLRLLVFILLGTLWSLNVQAQDDAQINFEKTTHEFGQLEKGAPAEFAFSFTNTSDGPVTLTRVKASCGCTTPSWTREPVAPGETGEIKVKYNTTRVGPFTKTVTVNYGEEGTRPVILYIKGNVSSGPSVAEVANVYQRPMGNLAFDELVRSVGTVDSDKEGTATFKVRNNGPMPISLTVDVKENPAMRITFPGEALKPGDTGEITVTAIGERFTEFGSFSERLVLNTNDQAMPQKVLTVNGTVNKVFTEAELNRMPHAAFEVIEYDAGKIISGEKVTYAYQFTNTGKDDLLIESVKASCGCTATAPKDKVVKGGATSEIVATFDSRGRKGVQQKSITVRTNDPDNEVLVLRLRAEVEEDPFHAGSLGPAEQKK
jgi:hypothetical protein